MRGNTNPMVLRLLVLTLAMGFSTDSIAQCEYVWSDDFSGTSALNNYVHALGYWDSPLGSVVMAGGEFTSPVYGIGLWNGTNWSALPGNAWPVRALEVRELGDVDSLYVGGFFSSVAGLTGTTFIAEWDGTSWSALGTGLGEPGSGSLGVLCLYAPDDRASPWAGSLFAGGYFSLAGSLPANSIAMWDGKTWSPLADGLTGCVGTHCESRVYAITGFDDGTGFAIYAAGNFTQSATLEANFIAKWNGVEWQSLGLGLNGPVRALAVFDDGDGASLYAAGQFGVAGGRPVSDGIAKWNGVEWSSVGLVGSAVGSGFAGGPPYALEVFDDGSGDALYAAGDFTVAGGTDANWIARWNGKNWSPLGTGISATDPYTPEFTAVYALESAETAGTPALVAGGFFNVAGNQQSWNIAQWSLAGVAPQIKEQPSDLSLELGDDAQFTVGATDAEAFQWRKDGIELEESKHLLGVTSGTLTIVSVTMSDAGLYDVLITSPCGSVLSQPAALVVTLPCPGDVSGNGEVGPGDLADLLAAWGPCDGCAADIAPPSGDGLVGPADLAEILASWGLCP